MIDNMNFISTGIEIENIANVIIVTIGRCTRYIQYAESDSQRHVWLPEPNLTSDSPMNP